MKKFATALFALTLLATTASFAATSEIQGEAALKKIIDRANPSQSNIISALVPLSGQWEYEAKVWTDPAKEPQKAFGSTINKMVLGNRFLSTTIMGNLNIDGVEVIVNGDGKIGYDNAKEVYTSVWTDSLSTGMQIGSGNFNEKEKTLTQTGVFTNPINGNEEKFRSEIKLVDTESYERTVYTTGNSGKENKLMEFKYTKPSFIKSE